MEATSVITDKYLAGWRGCDRAEDLQAEARAMARAAGATVYSPELLRPHHPCRPSNPRATSSFILGQGRAPHGEDERRVDAWPNPWPAGGADGRGRRGRS